MGSRLWEPSPASDSLSTTMEEEGNTQGMTAWFQTRGGVGWLSNTSCSQSGHRGAVVKVMSSTSGPEGDVVAEEESTCEVRGV